MKKDVIITIIDRLEKISKKGKGKRSRTLKIFAIFFLILLCNIKRCLFFKSVLLFHFILLITLRHNYNTTKKHFNKVFSHDITEAMLVFQNNETAAMLVSQTSPVGVELFSLFCSNKSHRCWQRE